MQTILWTPTSNADVVFHSVTLQTQVEFMEVIDQAEWGTLYYAMLAVSRLSSIYSLTYRLRCRETVLPTRSHQMLTLAVILRTMGS